jgi:prepilin-type N-terminal cleavage/methylation domain-containing protein
MCQKNTKKNQNSLNKGFTLIELLIVIGIIGVLAAFAYVALDPLARFQDSRNSRRWADVNMIISAIKLNQLDNKGSYIADIANMTPDEYYQIGAGSCSLICTSHSNNLIQPGCISLEDLQQAGYMPKVPVDPNADGASDNQTHYFIQKKANGVITVGACDPEKGSNSNAPDISISR